MVIRNEPCKTYDMENLNKPSAEGFKSGFIVITGAPNVGKSTLLNRMVGDKISITSRKPQTTRNKISGVVHRPFAQLVFIDTPGVHKARGRLNAKMIDAAFSSMDGMDIILVVVDAAGRSPQSEQVLISKAKKQKNPVILVLNKVDLVKKSIINDLVNKWSMDKYFQAVIPVSAKRGTNLEYLLCKMESLLPNGPPFFPEDAITDMPERFIAAEMIREKVFRLTGQEIPYSTAVTVENFTEDIQKSLVLIDAVIHVERNSQKGMIIGKNGLKLKKIGEESRKEIEQMVGVRVFLKLFVRVQKNWSTNPKALEKFGYL